MSWSYLAVVSWFVALICGLICAGYVDYTDPQRVAERQARQYAWNYHPTTMQPQLCGPERAR